MPLLLLHGPEEFEGRTLECAEVSITFFAISDAQVSIGLNHGAFSSAHFLQELHHARKILAPFIGHLGVKVAGVTGILAKGRHRLVRGLTLAEFKDLLLCLSQIDL